MQLQWENRGQIYFTNNYKLLTQLSHMFSDPIYLFFNNKRLSFAMQLATVFRKLAVAS